MSYKIVILKTAQKDKEKIKQIPSLKKNVENLLEVMKKNQMCIRDRAIIVFAGRPGICYRVPVCRVCRERKPRNNE